MQIATVSTRLFIREGKIESPIGALCANLPSKKKRRKKRKRKTRKRPKRVEPKMEALSMKVLVEGTCPSWI